MSYLKWAACFGVVFTAIGTVFASGKHNWLLAAGLLVAMGALLRFVLRRPAPREAPKEEVSSGPLGPEEPPQLHDAGYQDFAGPWFPEVTDELNEIVEFGTVDDDSLGKAAEAIGNTEVFCLPETTDGTPWHRGILMSRCNARVLVLLPLVHDFYRPAGSRRCCSAAVYVKGIDVRNPVTLDLLNMLAFQLGGGINTEDS